MGALGLIPIGLWSLENLENRFPKIHKIPPDAKGMIFLAGTFNTKASFARQEAVYNHSIGRLMAFAKLAKESPSLQLVYTGTPDEGALLKEVFASLHIDSTHILFEEDSKNTMGNAAKTAALLQPKSNEKWVLVTSAFHMPRSMGVFRKAGFNVIPYPVDYQTAGTGEVAFFPGLKENLHAWKIVSREWLGMLASYLTGRSATLYPRP